MAVVTPQLVKELRERTLAGMGDCKKALDASEGNMDKAIIFLREKGLANAAKKADRAASEGVVSAAVLNNSTGFVFEVNCETDFVTKNESFQAFVANLHNVILKNNPQSIGELLETQYEAGHSVKSAATQLVATIGENIHVRRFERIGNGKNFVGSYVHAGGKIGVLVELSGTGIEKHMNSSELSDISKDVALQAAAMKPQYLSESDISPAVIKSEEEIIRNKFIKQGKPEAALAKIIPSSLKTWFKEVCLSDQLFVKDDTKSVANYVLESGKKLGITDLKISAFVSLELGQGVEKKQEDFAAEVAATIATTK